MLIMFYDTCVGNDLWYSTDIWNKNTISTIQLFCSDILQWKKKEIFFSKFQYSAIQLLNNFVEMDKNVINTCISVGSVSVDFVCAPLRRLSTLNDYET